MADTFEPDDLIAMRAFPKAQELMGGVALRRLTAVREVGWHDTSVSPWTGAFCVVRSFADLDDLVGEILRFRYKDREVVALCREAADVPWDFSLYRRAFMPLAGLTDESVHATVEVVS